MNFLIRIIIIFFVFSIPCKSISQEVWGGKLGVNFQFGTHIQRLGAMYQLYAFNRYGQISQGMYVHFNLKNFGPKGPHVEMKFQLGFQGHWLESAELKYQFNELSDMAPYQNSVGYSFNMYVDSRGTNQTTGTFNFAFDKFLMAIDNDAFGTNQIDDKFRTGAFYFGYQSDSSLIGIQSTLWTGKSSDGARVDDGKYPSRFGYRDVQNAQFGKFTNGVLAARFDQYLGMEQVARGEVGVDAERVRHLIQNKLIHDGISGRLVKSESPHYPMFQENGSPYLFGENEKIKSPRLYFQLSTNQSAFY